MSADVHAYADQLRQYATHFAPRDWCYTRDLGNLRPLQYEPRWRSLLGAARRYFSPSHSNVMPEWRISRWRMAKAKYRAAFCVPDGVLDNGGVITVWEETGEYLQYVQPSVGALVADLMDAHPDLPEVQAIADEMKRINDDYGARIAAEKWDPDTS